MLAEQLISPDRSQLYRVRSARQREVEVEVPAQPRPEVVVVLSAALPLQQTTTPRDHMFLPRTHHRSPRACRPSTPMPWSTSSRRKKTKTSSTRTVLILPMDPPLPKQNDR